MPVVKSFVRFLWLVLAIVSFVGGIVGLLLPVIPQIPFFILCLFSLSKFSPRFHSWLQQTKLYQKYFLGFKRKLYSQADNLKEKEGSIKAKILAFFFQGEIEK